VYAACMTRRDEVLVAHREAIRAAADRNKVRRIFLVGSTARGDDGDDSDYDFLVEFENDEGVFQRAALIAALKKILNDEVDVIRHRAYRPPGRIRKAMLEDAILL